MVVSVRQDRARQAAQLAARGMTGTAIAAELGISTSYAYGLLTDPDGSLVRERKRLYDRQCADCGARIDGTSPGKSTGYCVTCSAKRSGFARRVWTRERIIAAIHDWAQVYGEPPAIADWSPTTARQRLHDEPRARRFETAAGRWPSFTTVVNEFGSWNAGIRAAGLTPREPHGGGGNVAHRRARVVA
jgi:hypothetical protein